MGDEDLIVVRRGDVEQLLHDYAWEPKPPQLNIPDEVDRLVERSAVSGNFCACDCIDCYGAHTP